MSFNLDHFDLSDEMEENWSQYQSEESNRSTTAYSAECGDPVLGGNYNYNHNSSVEMSTTTTSAADLETTSDYLSGPGSPIQFPPEMTNWDWDSLWLDNVPDECDPSLLSSPGEDNDMVKEKKMDNNNDIADQTNVAVACYEDNCSYEPSSFISSPFDASTSSYDNGDEDNVSLCESSIEFQFQTPASPLPTPNNQQYQQNNPRLGFHYGSLNSHQLPLATTTNAGFNLMNPETVMVETASIPHISESSTSTVNVLLKSNAHALKSASKKRRMSETMSRAQAESGYTTTTTTVQSQLKFTDLYTEMNGKQVKVEPVEIEDAHQNETSQPTLSLAAVHVKEKKVKRPKKYESADKNDPSVKNAIAAKANRDKKKQEKEIMLAEIRDLRDKLEKSEKNLKQKERELAIEKKKSSTSASNKSQQQRSINSRVNALIQPIEDQFGHMNVLLQNRNLQVNTNTTPNESLLTIHIYPVEQKLIFDYDPSFNFF